jgi:hypothetical protein
VQHYVLKRRFEAKKLDVLQTITLLLPLLAIR